jgi:hypothetical protein
MVVSYNPLIPTFSLKGEGADTCVDTYALREKEFFESIEVFLLQQSPSLWERARVRVVN